MALTQWKDAIGRPQSCITIAIQLHAELTCEANVGSASAMTMTMLPSGSPSGSPSPLPPKPPLPLRTSLPPHLEVMIMQDEYPYAVARSPSAPTASPSSPAHWFGSLSSQAPAPATATFDPNSASPMTPPRGELSAAAAAAASGPLPLSPIKDEDDDHPSDHAAEQSGGVSWADKPVGGPATTWSTEARNGEGNTMPSLGGDIVQTQQPMLGESSSFAFPVHATEVRPTSPEQLPLAAKSPDGDDYAFGPAAGSSGGVGILTPRREKSGGGSSGSSSAHSSYPPPSRPGYRRPKPAPYRTLSDPTHPYSVQGYHGPPPPSSAATPAEMEHALRELFRRQMWAYCQRTALLEYMGSAKMGISLFGFKLDRRFLQSLQTVVVSSFVFAISRAVAVH